MTHAPTLDWLQSDLKTVDEMLGRLAGSHGDFRSRSELLGGIVAAKDKLNELRQKVGAFDPVVR